MDLIQQIEVGLIDAFRISGAPYSFNLLIDELSKNPIFKGLFVMMLFWWLWAKPPETDLDRRVRLVGVLAVSIVAIFVGRVLAVTLPFRHRPLHAEGASVPALEGLNPLRLDGWSSLPSDHAVLFFAIAVALWRIDRLVGIVAIAHAILVISLPRIYLGLHFPTDIIAGALVGAGIALILAPRLEESSRWAAAVSRAATYRWLFVPSIFFVTFQVATLFESLRSLLSTFVSVLTNVVT